MVVIYAASETTSPAFVEGALIQRHKGALFVNRHALYIHWFPFPNLRNTGSSDFEVPEFQFHRNQVTVYPRNIYKHDDIFRCQGQPGCRNIRDGGETIKQGELGPFLVYVVYRSFKRASTAKLN